VLGAVDLDQYVEDTVKTAQEFDMNFRALKARRKDAEKVRSGTPSNTSFTRKFIHLAKVFS
jgi:hypothetical protein